MSKKIIYTEKAPKPIGPYSQAVLLGNILFVSGQIAVEESLNGNIESETRQVMEYLKAILEAADMNFSHVMKCSIFLKSMEDFGAVNGIYGSYFENTPPARETVEVKKLPKDVNVEISLLAAL